MRDETTKIHVYFMKKKGPDAYYAIMGVENDNTHNSFDDNSSHVNLGLFNIEAKNETDTEIEKFGIVQQRIYQNSPCIHHCASLLGAIRITFRCLKKRKAKAAMKKNNLKELVVSATGPGQGVYLKTFNQQLPMKQMIQNPPQEQNLDTQLVPINPQKNNQIVPVNMARMPLFQNSYYD